MGLFLANDDASCVNGKAIPVDGGRWHRCCMGRSRVRLSYLSPALFDPNKRTGEVEQAMAQCVTAIDAIAAGEKAA
jgi:hypothetical protein